MPRKQINVTRFLSLVLLLISNHKCAPAKLLTTRKVFVYNNFNKPREIAYNNFGKKSSLDSALILVTLSMQCNSIKKSVIEVKLRLLTALKKYKERTEFVDSLPNYDFESSYKKKLYHESFIAL